MPVSGAHSRAHHWGKVVLESASLHCDFDMSAKGLPNPLHIMYEYAESLQDQI